MKKNIIIPLFAVFLLISLISFSSAYFSWSHTKFIVQGFDEVSGPGTISDLCRNYESVFVDGETSADSAVVHYYDTGSNSKITSYISTHSKGAGMGQCLIEAGSDVRKKCFCYGMGIHSIQDQFSHLSKEDNGIQDGLVVKYLKSNFAPNFIGHMTIENNFDLKQRALIKEENPTLFAKVNAYDGNYLNNMFKSDANGALVPSDLTQLFADSTGIDPVNDLKLFRSGYLGQGFYNTVYKDKVSLPAYGYYIPAIIALIGLIGTVGLIFLGRNKFKYIAILPWIFLIIIGGIVFYSYYTGTTWEITTKLIELPASVGYLSVSQADVIRYDDLAQKATNQFLKDGILTVQDASGLGYTDSNGVVHTGALNQASNAFFWVWWLLGFPLIMIILIWSIWRSFKAPKRK